MICYTIQMKLFPCANLHITLTTHIHTLRFWQWFDVIKEMKDYLGECCSLCAQWACVHLCVSVHKCVYAGLTGTEIAAASLWWQRIRLLQGDWTQFRLNKKCGLLHSWSPLYLFQSTNPPPPPPPTPLCHSPVKWRGIYRVWRTI